MHGVSKANKCSSEYLFRSGRFQSPAKCDCFEDCILAHNLLGLSDLERLLERRRTEPSHSLSVSQIISDQEPRALRWPGSSCVNAWEVGKRRTRARRACLSPSRRRQAAPRGVSQAHEYRVKRGKSWRLWGNKLSAIAGSAKALVQGSRWRGDRWLKRFLSKQPRFLVTPPLSNRSHPEASCAMVVEVVELSDPGIAA